MKTPEEEAEEYCRKSNPSAYDLYKDGYVYGGVAQASFEDIQKAFLAGAKWRDENPSWVRVTDRLPEDEQIVLVFIPSTPGFGYRNTARFIKEYCGSGRPIWLESNGYSGCTVECKPTHWLLLENPDGLRNN